MQILLLLPPLLRLALPFQTLALDVVLTAAQTACV